MAEAHTDTYKWTDLVLMRETALKQARNNDDQIMLLRTKADELVREAAYVKESNPGYMGINEDMTADEVYDVTCHNSEQAEINKKKVVELLDASYELQNKSNQLAHENTLFWSTENTKFENAVRQTYRHTIGLPETVEDRQIKIVINDDKSLTISYVPDPS